MDRTRRCVGALTALVVVAAISATISATVPGAAGAAAPTSCPQYEEALRTYAPPGGWDVAQMSAIIARESSCNPAAHSARDSGLLQINDVNLAYLTAKLGTTVDRTTLTDPTLNIRAGAALCTYWQGRGESCYFPWKLDLYRPPASAAPTTTTAPAPVAGRCTQYEALLGANVPAAGWDVQKMSTIMSRTSGCNPDKRWASGTGLFRISNANAKWLSVQLGTKVDRTTLIDPTLNVRAAAAMCRASVATGRSCYRPWGG